MLDDVSANQTKITLHSYRPEATKARVGEIWEAGDRTTHRTRQRKGSGRVRLTFFFQHFQYNKI